MEYRYSVGIKRSMLRLQLVNVSTDSHLIQARKFRAAWIVGPKSCSLNWICPVTTEPRNLSLEQKLTLFDLSSLTISLRSLLLMLAYFNETRKPFPKSTSKTRSHIQSTAKYIFYGHPSNRDPTRLLSFCSLFLGNSN